MTSNEFKTNPEDIKNLLETCRLCLSEESIDCVIVEQNLLQQISDYLSIVISNEDGLSQNVCAICQLQITEFHQFRERCQEVQSTLQSIIHAENLVIKAELPSNNWYETNGSALEENDTHIEKGSGNFHQENTKVIENNTQSITIDSINKETSTDGHYIGKDVMFKIEDIIKQEETIEGQTPVPSTDEIPKSNESKKFKCAKCDEVFAHRRQLYYHRGKNHRKRIICPTCNRPCLSRQDCERHILTHQTDKPFKCDICQQAFKWKGDVSVHKKRVHGPRMHKCSLCESSFATRSALTRHMQSSVHAGSVTKLVADRKVS